MSRRDLVDFSADAFYVAPITELALLHAASASSVTPSTPSPSPAWSSTPVAGTFYFVANYSTDAGSADMLAYSLGAPITDGVDPFSVDVVYSSTDKLLSDIILGYWISFIRTGCVLVRLIQSLPSLLAVLRGPSLKTSDAPPLGGVAAQRAGRRAKLGTHYPCLRAVFTGRITRVSFWAPVFTGRMDTGRGHG